MTSLRNYPLGERCPKSPHAVVSSLPTMADVRGYEEHDPRVIEALTSGYPRFVVHAFIEELIGYYLRREGLEDRLGVLIPSRRATNDLIDYVGNWKRGPLCPHQDDGGEAGQVSEQSTRRAFYRTLPLTAVRVEDSLFLVHFDRDDRELKQRVRKFVQHTGCGISSRQAEDLLVRYRLRDSVHTECVVKDRLEEKVEGALAGLIGCESKDVLVCSCGMNAFYAGFRAVHEAQSSKGRTNWLQLGWLYLDSGCVLKEFLGESDSLDYCYDATDINEIVEKIESYGDTLACVVIECPTNPLVQVADLPRIKQAVRENGGILMVDPTIASIYNVDVLHYADILVTSLTKYASHLGDVMIGALALNPQSAHYGDLVLRSSSFYQPPYRRDLARLAFEMETAPEAVSLMDLNARRLADYLSGHHGVKQVHYAGYSDHFTEVAKSPGSGGAMISVELKGDIEPFYDALTAMKGPSFGTDFTLVCPFMFLAHYDMVTSEEGTNFLRSIGIDPNLIRISVGVEPIEDIIRIFESALSN
jgi:cystathionine gamma-synthase